MKKTIKEKIAECKTVKEKNEILRMANLSRAGLSGANLRICGKWSCSYDETIIRIGCKKNVD